MPKRKPSRRNRTKRASAPAAPTPTTRTVARPVAVAAKAPTAAEEQPPERATTRDFGYVGREIQRILVLAGAILVVIVVLSFFVP